MNVHSIAGMKTYQLHDCIFLSTGYFSAIVAEVLGPNSLNYGKVIFKDRLIVLMKAIFSNAINGCFSLCYPN